AFARAGARDRDLAKLSSRSQTEEDPRGFRQRAYFRSLLRALSKLFPSFWVFLVSLSEKRTVECQCLPHAEREGRGARACAWRASRSGSGARHVSTPLLGALRASFITIAISKNQSIAA